MAELIQYCNYDITLDEANPSINWNGSPTMIIGVLNGQAIPPSVYRGLFYFDISSLLSQNILLQNCTGTFNMYISNASSRSVADYFTPYVATSFWSTTTKWATQPSVNYSIRGSSSQVQDIGYVSFDITSLLQYWLSGAGFNYGFMVQSTENVNNSTKTIVSHSESTKVWLRPYLDVKFTDALPVSIYERRFISTLVTLNATTVQQLSSTFDVSKFNDYTLFIENAGANPITATLVVSPDTLRFSVDRSITLAPSEFVPVAAKYLSKYIAFYYFSTGGPSSINIWLQEQT